MKTSILRTYFLCHSFPPLAPQFLRKSRHFLVQHFSSHIHPRATGLFGLQAAQKPCLSMSLLTDIKELIWYPLGVASQKPSQGHLPHPETLQRSWMMAGQKQNVWSGQINLSCRHNLSSCSTALCVNMVLYFKEKLNWWPSIWAQLFSLAHISLHWTVITIPLKSVKIF